MKTAAFAMGFLMIGLSLTVNAGAYHFHGGGSPVVNLPGWTNPGNGAADVVVCEQEVSSAVPPSSSSTPGIGGLCYADSGYDPAAGRPSTSTWGEVVPVCTTCFGGDFLIRVGNNNHACTGAFGLSALDEFQYQELLAYWVADGHVWFAVHEPGTEGGYMGTSGLSDPGSGYCNAQQTVAIL